MAEPEEIDEDLFADLYEADEPAPRIEEPVAQATPVEPAPPVPVNDDGDRQVAMTDGGDAGYTTEVPAIPTSLAENSYDQGHGAWQGDDMEADNDRADSTQAEPTGIAIKEDGKMFIGGLNWETTDESLRRHFEEFGEVLECTVMRDTATGRSRGFGFLTFKDPKTVNTVMVKEHFLDGKIIDPKRAIPREEQERTSKIFVGGVSQEATEEDFKNYFMQYGRVIDATLMIDKDTKRPRGFGFVTFDSEGAVEATLKGDLAILGKPIEVKRAQPRGSVKEDDDASRRGGRRAGGMGGGRGDMHNDNGGMNQGGGGMGYASGMTPQMMAQYFQRMQQYFAQMMSNMGGAGGMGGGMMNGMNPAMMQQMQLMQRMQQQGGTGMTPQMLQQMQQMQQMQQQQGAGGGNSNGAPSGLGGNNAGAGRGRGAGGVQNMGYQQQGGPTSWEGMYDDVPQPDMGGGRRDQGYGYGGRGGRGQASKQPSAAPANAPTGPRNAGLPGANYRGGGRGNHHRGGFHPYGRR